jgi:hypothetical protein
MVLAKLDEKNGEKFPLIVVNSQFGMRGFDYRAPKNGLNLVIHN